MKINRLPSGSYRIQLQVNGKRVSITRKTRKEAETAALNLLIGKVATSDRLFGSLVDEYIADRENVASPQTIIGYKKIRRNNLTDLYDIPLNKLTNDLIQTSINRMAAGHSPKTVRNAVGLVSATLRVYAPSFRLQVTVPASKPVTYHLPTADDISALLALAGDNMRTAIMLAAFCSLRRSEIAALRAEDISGDKIHVCRAVVHSEDGRDVEKGTKTYSADRIVTAPSFVVDQISGRTGRVCPITVATITREFCDLRDKLGLKCRFHDLRHYYASYLHAHNVPDEYIKKYGGWKSSETLGRIYRNTLSDYEEKYARFTADLFARVQHFPQTSHETPSKPLNTRLFQGFDSPGSHSMKTSNEAVKSP